MAKKQRVRISNSRPRHNFDPDILSVTTAVPPAPSATAVNDSNCTADSNPGAATNEINQIVKHSIHEVGQNGSSFPGTDSYGNPIEGATFAQREKQYHRYDLIEGLVENGLIDEEGFPLSDADVTLRQYLYDNPTVERQQTSGSFQNILIRKDEDQTVLFNTYDEQYFQHIFNWPTSHTLRTRKVGGFLQLTEVETASTGTAESEPGAGDGSSCSKTKTTYTLYPQEQYYNVNFTLADVIATIYQPNPEAGSIKGDKVWNYNQLTFDPTTGKLQNKDQGIRDKLGDPIIYYGDGNSNAIFFNYLQDATKFTSVVTHDFDDNNNVDNDFDVVGNINVVVKNKQDPGGSNDSNNRKHYDITFPKDIVNTGNIRIHFNEKKTASGLVRSRLYVSRIKQIGTRKIRAWFETEDGNTFARNWTVSIGGGETGTTNVVGIGDTVNGATVTNVINYVEEVALLRMVVEQPKKGVEDSAITQADFLALTNPDGSSQNLNVADYAATRSWLKLNDIRDIIKGMDVQGDGIKTRTTTITGVDYTKNIIYITDTVKSKKLKNLKFIDSACNRVSMHTMCYATLSGGSDFSIDADYPVTRNGQTVCAIKTRAGKGILNRSGIVGTWFSEVKHEIEYQPIFYGSDSNCEKELDSDEFGEYTLGTIIWNDNTRTESVYLLTNPADNFAYTASQVHFALTYAPIDQATLQKIDRQVAAELGNAKSGDFLDRMNEENPTLTTRYIIFNKVSDHCKNVLSEKKAAAVFDDICREDIEPSYFEMYDAISEQTILRSNVTAVEQDILDYCGIANPTINPALEGAEKAASTSDILPPEYYKQFISNPDSLMNRLKNGFDIIEKTRPKNKIDKLPPQIVGEDQSGRVFTKTSFRDLPPRTDRVGYFCNDLVITDDKYLNPVLDLDPQTTINQPKIIIRSKPTWTASNNGQTWPISIATPGGALTTSMSVTVNNSGGSGGHVGNITTSAGAVSAPVTVITGVGDNTTTTTYSIQWVALSDPNAKRNAQFFTRDAFPNVYTISTNVSLPPGGNHADAYAKTDLRDLLYLERPKDADENYKTNMLTAPTNVIYPAIIWEPSINYQQDFHKILEFRLQEHSELIGETIQNKGNPYVDKAITVKLTKDLKVGDTSITVESTGEFLSSGYLIIPKYTKKVVSLQTGNNSGYYTYSGEEIIYYGSKTETKFKNIQRGMFGTTSGFEETVSVESVEEGVRYKIASLGSSNWKKIGAGKNPSVGDTFTANKYDGVGTGTVIVFGTCPDETPDEELLVSLLSSPKVPVITSYEKGFSIAQHSVFTLKY
jgi:hypothetical protein